MQKAANKRVYKGIDLNLFTVIAVSILVLVLAHYYPITLGFPASTELVYYLVIPLAAGFIVLRRKPWDYGMRIGNWRAALLLTAICLAVMVALVYWSSRMAEFRDYYHSAGIDWADLLLETAIYMFAWEFLFRGYMYFGLEESIGKNAIFIQAIPFVLLHIDKPFLETLSCIPSGFIFGYISYRTRSFLPCFVIHCGIYVMMIAFTA